MVIEILHSSLPSMEKNEQRFSQLTDAEKTTHRIFQYWTPKDKAAWLDILVKLVKQRICLNYTNEQDLRIVIDAARRTIGKKYSKTPVPYDSDMPECYYWNEHQVADWIAQNGYPELREAFLVNHISGRKLIAVDASVLSKMGLRYFDVIKDVVSKIRQLLGIPRPNMMRGLLRLVPLELFLRERISNGLTYDLLTFKKFCLNHGFPYDYLAATNKTGLIPETVKLILYFKDSIKSPAGSDESSENLTLVEAPTVEFVTRNAIIRNRIVEQIIAELIDNVCTPDRIQKYDLAMDSVSNLLNKGLNDLGLSDPSIYGTERLEFVTQVGKDLIQEMLRTVNVLQDIQTTRKHLRKAVSREEFEEMKLAAHVFVKDVMPIAALLSLGQLDLNSIFKEEPQLHHFIDQIVEESEQITNELVPESRNFIAAVITEAKLRIVTMLYPDLPEYTLRSASKMVTNLLDDLIETALNYPDLKQRPKSTNETIQDFPVPLTHPNIKLLQEWKQMRMPRPRQQFTSKEKFDVRGNPMLEKLDSKELLDIIETGNVQLSNGIKIYDKDWIVKAKEEQKKQRQVLSEIAEQQTLHRRYPGTKDSQGVYHEYTDDEKLSPQGIPLLSRLNFEELDKIISDGTIKGKSGTLKRLSLDWIDKAKNEKEKRIREEAQQTAQLENYHRQNPGTFDQDGRYREYSQNEKMDENHLPIVDRLTIEELDILILSGKFDGSLVQMSTKNEIISLAKIEKHKRQQEDLNAIVEQASYRRRYPGTVNEFGQYNEYTEDEKFDGNPIPILDRLTMDELEAIIEFGAMKLSDGLKFLSAEVIAQAKIEKRKRDHDELQDKINLDHYRKKFPGKLEKTDDKTRFIFHEFSLDKKYDSQALPIVERLNVNELDHLIETGEFNGIKVSEKNVAQIIDMAQIEKYMRDQDEIQANIEEEVYRKIYPGRIVDGAFREFSKEEKYYPDSAGVHSNLPIIERLNNEELDAIIKSGVVVMADGRKVQNKEIVKQAKIERDKRQEEAVQEMIQQNIHRMKTAIMKNRAAQQGKEFTQKEKIDAMGKVIVEHLTDQEYLLKYPKSDVLRVQSIMNNRLTLQDYLDKFDQDNQHVDRAQHEQLKKRISEQMRLETLEAIKEMIDRSFIENRPPNTEQSTQSEDQNQPHVASLALFNGFIINDTDVVGTVDPFQGKVRNQNGEVIGVINSNGILFTNDGNLVGKIGADVEQIGVGKFRALPKQVDSLVSSRVRGATTTTGTSSTEIKEGKLLAKWNADQAVVKGGLLMQKGDELIRQANYTPNSDAANTRLALQIQTVEGYKPSQVILLDSESIAKLQDELKQSDDEDEDDEWLQTGLKKQYNDENDDKQFVWKRAEKKKKKRKEREAKPLTAQMLKGEVVNLKLFNKEDMVHVPIPGSTGKWGVQDPPTDLPEFHEFKPPPPIPQTETISEEPPKGNDILTKVHTGEAKKLVDAEGTFIADIRKDGQIFTGNGDYVGYVQSNGLIVKADGTPMKNKGLKVIRQNGVIVGQINDKGKLIATREADRFLIGTIWGDGRIVTLNNVLVGVVTKDGRILGPGGKAIGLFTPTWEILGSDGIPFAYVTAEGKVYRYEVIPQTRYIPQQQQGMRHLNSEHDKNMKSETVVLFKKDNHDLETAFEILSLEKQSSHNLQNQSATPELPHMDDYHHKQTMAAKEKARQLEIEMRQYDLDESHKHAKTPTVSSQPIQMKTPVSPAARTPNPHINDQLHSRHDHRVAKVDPEYLKQKQLKRQQMVDNWVNQVGSLSKTVIDPSHHNIFDSDMSEDDRKRMANTAADKIIDDIFKLALTHLLLQAEAGHNTKKIMECLEMIQTTGDDEHTQAMWKARLSQVGDTLNATTMLPQKDDIVVVQQLINKKNIAKEKGDKAIQHNDKVNIGVTVNLQTQAQLHHHHHQHHHHHERGAIIDNPKKTHLLLGHIPTHRGQQSHTVQPHNDMTVHAGQQGHQTNRGHNHIPNLPLSK